MYHRAVRHLPDLQGPAAWDAILPSRAAYPTAPDNARYDVVIVGAGFAGLSAARRLTQIDPKLRIAVLDALAIGQGGTGRNSGFMIDLPHELTSDDYAGGGDEKTLIRFNRYAQDFGQAAVDEYGIDPNYFDKSGKINGAVGAAALDHNATYARHLDDLGEGYEMLDAQAMRDVTGSTHYQSGLYTPGTVMLQPAGYIRGLAAGLARQGVDIFERSPVIKFEKSGSHWVLHTDRARIDCGQIILGVNGHLESFGYARGRLMQVFLFAAMTPELDRDALTALGGQPRWGITPSDPMGTTMRRIDTGQGGNRIITRTCAVLRSGLRASPNDVARAARIMQHKFDERFPKLAGLPMQYTWAGHLCLSSNGVSVTCEILTNLFSACVQNGLGTARGTLTGIAAAEMACGLNTDLTAHFQNETALKALPPRLIRDIGANAVLRYKEWRARSE